MKNHVINRWFQKLLSAFAFVGLLSYGNAQAQIAIQDGGLTLVHANTSTISTSITITAGASVLVVSLFTRDNDSTTDPFVGNVTCGSTQLTQGVWTNNANSTYASSDIYYLFNPPVGTQTITATDTYGGSGATDMQVYTLNKVNTTVAPAGYFTNSPSALSLTFQLLNVPISALAAVNASFGTGNSTESFGVTSSSGSANTAYIDNVIEQTMGYVANLNPGSNSLTAAPVNYTGNANKFAFVALAFTPSAYTVAPTNVMATGQNSQIALKWNDATGGAATNYIVFRSTTSGGGYTAIATNTSNASTNYTDTSVVNYTTYYYVLQAEGPAGLSADSAQVSASAFGPLPAPMGLIAVPLNGQAGLIWTAVPGATGYNVLRATSNPGSQASYSVIASPATALYTNTTLANGTTYYYEVNAVNGFGAGADSPYVSATPAIPNAGIYLHDGGVFSTQTVVNGSAFPAVTNVSITMNFQVSPGANTMVAELLDVNGDDTTNGSPSFIIWSNATLGTTQILTRAVSQNEAQYAYEDCDLYYLWNPSPGAGTLSCTDMYTNGSVSGAMLLQGYTLSGVDSTYNGGAPFTASIGENNAFDLTVTTAGNTPNQSWAAAMSVNYAGGGGNFDTNTASSGTSFCYNFQFNLTS